MTDHRNDFGADFFIASAERDPVKAARDAARPLPKRFYKAAAATPLDHGYGVSLDGRPVNTPAKRRLVVPSKSLAEALAAEWAAQDETIDPRTMPLTRLVNSALDGVAERMAETEAEVVKYGGSDLVCYRAGEPKELVAAQSAAWDPLVGFARDKLGARLTLVEGVTFASQSEAARAALAAVVRDFVAEGEGAPLRLAALHVMTTLTGSLIIALALARGEIDLARAWSDAHIDDDFQMRVWGEDEEAKARRAARFGEMRAAFKLLEFLKAV